MDLPEDVVVALRQVTAVASPEALAGALAAAWAHGRRYGELLAGGSVPGSLFEELDSALAGR
ncbi:hypothetical protein Ato02nite_003120 [Paractinoplanes toevensis]|uniref:Uncharacterized protein n=1 Tax=Paractinoplanes toevensis TaxID=571911 RepID=A0A919VZW3_9ACTN|nr:hypothetical protein Ato02nite_003120 [Actinoplanes toevensis]